MKELRIKLFRGKAALGSEITVDLIVERKDWTVCDSCKQNTVPLLATDTSMGEYGDCLICIQCLKHIVKEMETYIENDDHQTL